MINLDNSSVYFDPPRFPAPAIPGGEPDDDWPADDRPPGTLGFPALGLES